MTASLRRIGALARLILMDGIRRRALLGLFLLTLAVEFSGLFFFNFVPRDIGRVLVDYVVTLGWAAGMLFLLFHAVQVMSWGEDRRVIQVLLAHPLSRGEYVTGVFAGLLFLLLALNVSLAVIGYLILLLIKGGVGPAYFSVLGGLEYALAWYGVFCLQVMLLAAIALFSGLVRGGFSVFLLSVAYYLIGSGLPVALEFAQKEGGYAQHLLAALSYVFPNFQRWDYKGFVVLLNGLPPAGTLIFDLAYVLLYCVLVLSLASRIYATRDIK